MKTTSLSVSLKTLKATSNINMKIIAMETILRCRLCVRCITGQLKFISIAQVCLTSLSLKPENYGIYEGSAKCESSLNFYFSSAEPINIFHSSYKTDYEPIRLSYHNGVHYNAVLNPNKPSVGVGLGLSGYKPWVSEHCAISIFPSCHLIFPYTCKSVTLLIMW